MVMFLIAAAIGPGLIFMHRAYAADLHEPEPVRHVFWYCVAGGMGAYALTLQFEGAILSVVGPPFQVPLRSVWGQTLAIFLGVAFVEELAKFLVLGKLARGDREIDEPFDWVVYAVAVSLGFATLENLVFVLQGGPAVAWARALTAVPAHAACGTTMGWWLARGSLRSPEGAERARFFALLEPTLWHGVYDTLVLYATAVEAPFFLIVMFVVGRLALNQRRIANLQVLTARAWPVPPICYPLRFRIGRRRHHPSAAEPSPADCCICHAPIRRVLGIAWDLTKVRVDETSFRDAHAACARPLRMCTHHGQLHLGQQCPRCIAVRRAAVVVPESR